VILLDTHALLWWTLDPDKLSRRARAQCRKMEERGGFISSISIWELGIKIKNGQLEIGMTIEDFAANVEATGIIAIIPVDTRIWLRNLSLAWDNRDPADRTIAATALMQNIPILTKDKRLRSAHFLRTIW